MAQEHISGQSPAMVGARILAPLTIFLGAFFLFQVEPLIAKMIVPWFGGSAEVWTACLLFFQSALLAGYLYAHLVNTRLSPEWQMRVHSAVLLASLALLPILPSERWKPLGDADPLPLILGLLAATIGLPFLALSATAPLVQAWVARARTAEDIAAGRTPYRLFALSNLASMVALLSYPVLIEPLLPIRMQGLVWSAGYAVFVVIAIGTAWAYRAPSRVPQAVAAADGPGLDLRSVVMWLLLSAAPSALLLAVTNHMLRNIAAIPLLWVVPLALYLLSFIVCFDRPRWYYRPVWYVLFALAAGEMIYLLAQEFPVEDARIMIAFYAGGLFICCMTCHGELAAMKPSARHLTAYYLCISLGGAIGGLFVAAVAPQIFTGYFELPVLLPVTALLVLYAAWRHFDAPQRHWVQWVILFVTLTLWTADTVHMTRLIYDDETGHVFTGRNFYGALKVTDYAAVDGSPAIRQLTNGTILHGTAYTTPGMQNVPISYYSPLSGIGITLQILKTAGPVKVGTVGLGTGTVAGFCRAEDDFTFYDINPLVKYIATTYFWFLPLCPAHLNVVMGDARLSMERQPPQGYDALAIDAFSSDAIPIHLLTKEAFAQYWRHLKPNGVLVVHVSNKFVDLAPIAALAAEGSGKTVRLVSSFADVQTATEASEWVLITSRPGFFDEVNKINQATLITVRPGLRPWTDDYSNLWQVLRTDNSFNIRDWLPLPGNK